MNVETVAEWTQMLEQLAAEDQAVAVEAADRCRRLEHELAQAREHEELVALMARHSREALDKTGSWLERLRAAAGSAREHPEGADPVPESVSLFADGQGK
ncbi:hypothetical protein NC315_34280 [Streptomyces sp. G2]|uniref:hypothetical protein n=1 Tax=Streptomyces sp. G2 TaxID=1684471 RepID=UPI00202E3F2B|nr:hypothetical protein [Streptomyces sp. G2]MCM1950400.1 hypothetical protein [Streptomyces sp. G2]